jgi:hypothetical protein
MTWRIYGLENTLAYSLVLAFAWLFLFFKRKNYTKKAAELLQLKQNEYRLTNNILAQQKVANLIIRRLHNVNESIGDSCFCRNPWLYNCLYGARANEFY